MITRDIVEVEKIGVFQCKVMIICGSSDSVKKKAFKKGLAESFIGYAPFGFENEEISDFDSITSLHEQTIVIQINPSLEKRRLVNVISHEVYHAVSFIMLLMKADRCSANEEICAYTTGYLSQFLYDKIIDYIE